MLAICAGNSPVTGELPAQRPVTRSFDVFFDLRLNTRLSKQRWGWWFETSSLPLWLHCDDIKNFYVRNVALAAFIQRCFMACMRKTIMWYMPCTWITALHKMICFKPSQYVMGSDVLPSKSYGENATNRLVDVVTNLPLGDAQTPGVCVTVR